MIPRPKDVWLRCGHPVTDTRRDRGCQCGHGWTDPERQPWHMPADLDTTGKIAWINEHTGNVKPFRYPREWQPPEPRDAS